MPKTVLFYRNYAGFTGGHLKVSEYMDHVRSHPAYRVSIYVAPGSVADHLWQDDPDQTSVFEPHTADILFVAGRDWQAVPAGVEDETPVVNLIQGLRHADPQDVRHGFLARQATRICVSDEVSQALQATGLCRGPIKTVPVALDVSGMTGNPTRTTDVFIAGLKAPALAVALARRLESAGLRVVVQTDLIARQDFLGHLADARIAVTLPYPTEGLFLPPLEAMASGCLVVCPDAGGNRGVCIDGQTCLMPPATPEALAGAVLSLMPECDLSNRLRAEGRRMAESRGAQAERRAFLNILNGISPRNIILTGLPRSGTTLSCSLLGDLPNVVALNEPMAARQLAGLDAEAYAAKVLTFFEEQRHSILTDGTAISKTEGGRVPRNPLADEVVDGHRKKVIDGKTLTVSHVSSPRFDLCIKHPAMFTARLPHLEPVFDCFALVRNPLSVLLSWRNSGMDVSSGHAPAAERHDPELAERLAGLDQVLDRQLALLDYMFARYRDYVPDRTIRYEDVVSSGGAVLSAIVPAAAGLSETLSSRNDRVVGTDAATAQIARRLLETDHACWSFYRPEDVHALLAAPAAGAAGL